MKISNHLLIIFLTLSKIYGIELPVNSSDISTISNWMIAKVNESNSQQISLFIDNPNEFFESLSDDKKRELYMSNYNDVTIALYQLYDEIDFKSTFIMACIVESKNEQISGFYYDNYDMDATIYINGQVAMSQQSGDKRYFENKLKRGKNIVSIIGKPSGRYSSAFNLFIFDEKLAQLDLQIVDQNENDVPYARTYFNDNKTGGFFDHDENGKKIYWLEPGSYKIAALSEKYQWSTVKLVANEKKKLKLVLSENERISGTVFTKDDKTPHPGVQVEAINGDNGDIFWSRPTGPLGRFTFRPPNGKWHIRIYANGQYKYHETNGVKTLIETGKSPNKEHKVDFSIPNQIKGSWGQISMFDGMLSNGAHVSIVSSEDLLYLGTYNGLSIYDGLRVKSYNYDQGLPNGFIAEIFEDAEGFIWIGYGLEGLVKWKNGKVIKHFNKTDGLPSNRINAIAQDKDGNLLVGTSDGLSIFDGKEFTNYNFTHGLGNGFITDINVVGNNIWVGCGRRSKTGGAQAIGGGLSIFNGKTFKSFDLSSFQNIDPNVSAIRVIKKDEMGNMWIGTEAGLLKYDGSKFHLYSVSDGLPARGIADIIIDDNGLWLCTNNGLANMSNDGIKVIVPIGGEGLTYEGLQSISRSNDGIYFIGSANGVYLYDPNSFRTITYYEGMPVPNNWTQGILDIALDREGFLWAASGAGGVYKLNDDIIVENFNKSNSGMQFNYTVQMEFANDGSIWFAHSRRGISKYSNGKMYNMTEELNIPSYTQIDDIAFDNEGTIWLGTSRGLGMYKNGSLTIYDESDGLIRPEYNSDVNVGNNNEIIYSTYGSGLSIYDGKSFTNYDETNGLVDNRIWDLAIDSKNNYWLALDGSGVQMFDGKEFHHHKISDGVTAGETFTAYVDDFDNIWIGTFGGGVCYYDGNVWNSVDTRDGLLDDLVGSIYSVDGNKYWFGSERGITAYVPKRQTPIVYIQQIETSAGTFESLDELKEQNHSLQKNSRITFTLNSNSFNTKKEKQKYIVNVVKNGKKESKLIKTNEFEFFPDKSGSYQLEFQALDRDMNYSKTKTLELSIVGPWYTNPSTAIPFWGFIIFMLSFSGFTTNKYLSQRRYTLSLKDESQKKDREARARLEEKNSELLESQKAAEAANEAKSTFLANMSHELRTPLNAIIGYSEMLIEDAEDENEEFIPDLDKINNSGKHLLGLINDILDLSKVESGKMELYLEDFKLKNVITEIESTIKPLVEKNSNTLKVEYLTDLISMKADVTKIRQILLNLLSNSAKFTKEGSISIKVSDSNNIKDAIDFIITDTGIGMSPDQVEKVFKPFTQADEKTTRKFGGTGLGLTITKMFAEMMGGSIDINSEEGKGTTFIVTIPVNVVDKSKETIELNDQGLIEEGYTILVIDDDDNAQDMMKKFLEKQNFRILQAKNGEHGLKLAAEYMPDAITLDVMMPEMDGWEVLAALQGNEKTKNIPVIMLTMADEPDIGYSLGATDYLTKPVNWEELSTILRKHQIESDSQSILIVEDDETTRDMLRKSLETNEYKVRSAVNGKEALEKIQSSKPGLILLDLMMPEMDGFEFAERLRENKEWLDIPVVVITAKDLTKEDHARLKGNVEAIMQKGSYNKNELLNEVSERIKKITEG